MQKKKLNLHIYGIHLLNPYETVASHLKKDRTSARLFALLMKELEKLRRQEDHKSAYLAMESSS